MPKKSDTKLDCPENPEKIVHNFFDVGARHILYFEKLMQP